MKPIKPYDFGEKLLVDQCRKIAISDLLNQYYSQLKTMALSADVLGVPIPLATSKTRFGGKRYWFSCPICSKRIGTVYQHPVSGMVGCRICLNLDYRKRRYKGMVEESVPDMSDES